MNLEKYNSFYKNKLCREILFDLDKGLCKGCNDKLKFNKNFHVGHIIPQADAHLFKSYYPKLDIDNILNLHSLCSTCNLKANRFQTYSVFMLNQLFNESLKRIELRLEKILNSNDLNLHKIESFLIKNKNVDLFSSSGKMFKNKDVLDAISLSLMLDNADPIFILKKIEYFSIEDIESFNFDAVCKIVKEKIKEANNNISSDFIFELKKHKFKSNTLIIKNKKGFQRKLKAKLIELGSEIVKNN